MRIVIPSVDYADYLAFTLPAWRAIAPDPGVSIVVVTAPRDKDTQAVARDNGAGVVVTDAWFRDGHTFDKAAALDEAFGFVGSTMPTPNKGERCISADADVYPFGKLPTDRARKGTVYGCPRYACESIRDLHDHVEGKTTRDTLPLICPRKRGAAPYHFNLFTPGERADMTARAARACLGYFQLFGYTGQRFGSFRTAGGYDIAFRDSFERREGLREFYVLHLGPMTRKNWRGRVLPAWGAA